MLIRQCNMEFTQEEKFAVIRILERVAKADEKIAEEEMQVLLKASIYLDVHESEILESKDMSHQRAGEILRGMDRDKQQLINSTLINLMASDGSIDIVEVRTLLDTYFGEM